MLYARHYGIDYTCKAVSSLKTNEFTLHLQAATKYEKFNKVTSFSGQDTTGKFGLMANHEHFITILEFGLVKYKTNSRWVYIALPGGVLHFVNNELFISTRQYFIDEDYARINEILEKNIRNEEEKLQNVKQSLHKM